MAFIYFVGTYKPIMCGIADYTDYITRESPPRKWGVISFDLESYREPLIESNDIPDGQVWYGIPSHYEFSASAILKGINQLGGKDGNAVLWFQHDINIWRDSQKFVTMLADLDMPKIVTFHTLHFQDPETPSGLRKYQYDLLRALLPQVEAITVFSRGVYWAVVSAFPEYCTKVHIIKHGINEYQGCVAFIIRGVETVRFTLTDGVYYKYVGVNTQNQAEKLFQERVNYLRNEHTFCKSALVREVRIEEKG